MHLDHAVTYPHRHTHGADPVRGDGTRHALRLGLGGPVGSGKTATVAALCRALRAELSMAVVTNDIYTREDAEFLLREAVLPPERITAVETGACPHTAIRDDISANLEAVEELEETVGPLDLILVESGGDNLTATFSRGLVDAQIFVIDVAGGDDIPRKGGPGVTTADLLIVNKTDLAPTSVPTWSGWPGTPPNNAVNSPSPSSPCAGPREWPRWPTGCAGGSPPGRPYGDRRPGGTRPRAARHRPDRRRRRRARRHRAAPAGRGGAARAAPGTGRGRRGRGDAGRRHERPARR